MTSTRLIDAIVGMQRAKVPQDAIKTTLEAAKKQTSNINQRDLFGNTALIYAVMTQNPIATEYLSSDLNCDFFITNNAGRNALSYAGDAKIGHTKIFRAVLNGAHRQYELGKVDKIKYRKMAADHLLNAIYNGCWEFVKACFADQTILDTLQFDSHQLLRCLIDTFSHHELIEKLNGDDSLKNLLKRFKFILEKLKVANHPPKFSLRELNDAFSCHVRLAAYFFENLVFAEDPNKKLLSNPRYLPILECLVRKKNWEAVDRMLLHGASFNDDGLGVPNHSPLLLEMAAMGKINQVKKLIKRGAECAFDSKHYSILTAVKATGKLAKENADIAGKIRVRKYAEAVLAARTSNENALETACKDMWYEDKVDLLRLFPGNKLVLKVLDPYIDPHTRRPFEPVIFYAESKPLYPTLQEGFHVDAVLKKYIDFVRLERAFFSGANKEKPVDAKLHQCVTPLKSFGNSAKLS